MQVTTTRKIFTTLYSVFRNPANHLSIMQAPDLLTATYYSSDCSLLLTSPPCRPTLAHTLAHTHTLTLASTLTLTLT